MKLSTPYNRIHLNIISLLFFLSVKWSEKYLSKIPKIFTHFSSVFDRVEDQKISFKLHTLSIWLIREKLTFCCLTNWECVAKDEIFLDPHRWLRCSDLLFVSEEVLEDEISMAKLCLLFLISNFPKVSGLVNKMLATRLLCTS